MRENNEMVMRKDEDFVWKMQEAMNSIMNIGKVGGGNYGYPFGYVKHQVERRCIYVHWDVLMDGVYIRTRLGWLMSKCLNRSWYSADTYLTRLDYKRRSKEFIGLIKKIAKNDFDDVIIKGGKKEENTGTFWSLEINIWFFYSEKGENDEKEYDSGGLHPKCTQNINGQL